MSTLNDRPDEEPQPSATGGGRRPRTAAETSPQNPWPVRLLTAKIEGYINRMPPVWVEGQVVQVTHRGNSNTVFLTLRDTAVDQSLPVSAARRVVDTMASPLVDGAHVVVRAEPSYWTRRGSFSLNAVEIRPVGVGELLARIEQLKRVLAAEGLFATDRKRPLPFLPTCVGLVCGRDSAAEHDVVVNGRDRWPGVRFEIRRVAVQGQYAVDEVSAAVRELDSNAEVDVIVVARGGGSLEDLLPFSNEALVRLVADARTPVVSAIGHESDTPLLDLVADLRASTPTDAAKRIVPAIADELAGLTGVRDRLRRGIRHRLEHETNTVTALRSRPVMRTPMTVIDAQATRLDDARRRGRLVLTSRLDQASTETKHLRATARALSPVATIDRGYAVIAHDDGTLVTSTDQTRPGQTVRIRLRDGRIVADVTHIEAEPQETP